MMGGLAKHVELRKDEPLYDLAISVEFEPDGVNVKITAIIRKGCSMKNKFIIF